MSVNNHEIIDIPVLDDLIIEIPAIDLGPASDLGPGAHNHLDLHQPELEDNGLELDYQGSEDLVGEQTYQPGHLDQANFHQQSNSLDQNLVQTSSLQHQHHQQQPQVTRRLTLMNGQEITDLRRDLATDSKTPAEYTLHILFTQFVRYAERKLNLCLNQYGNGEPQLIDLLSEGIDPVFDGIIAALGYIARRKPKPVIDSVMFWRRSKSEVAAMAASALDKAVASHFSNKDVLEFKETAIQAERKSLISIFILCRVLIEVVRQTPTHIIGDDLGDKLEEIIYTQLKTTDPVLVSKSIIRSSNWDLFAEFLGHMSAKRFLSVSDRFIADLEKHPQGFSDQHMSEASLCLLIHGMRYLKMSNETIESFEDAADFLKSIAKFFYKCENDVVIVAYCEVLNQLLLSLAGVLTAEVNHPTWVEAIEIIYDKSVSLMRLKPQKFWGYGLQLSVAALSVAPQELFKAHWLSIIEVNSRRLKPKTSNEEKVIVVISIARLVWAYLFRYPDTLNLRVKNIESIAQLLFQNQHKKQQWITLHPLVVRSLVQLLRAFAFSNITVTLETILLPLLKTGFNGTSLDGLSQEKIMLCSQTYIAILGDYKAAERPPFPNDDVLHLDDTDDLEVFKDETNGPFDESSSNAAIHEEISGLFTILLQLLDDQVGCKVLQFHRPNASATSSPMSSSTSSLGSKLGLYLHVDDSSDKNKVLFSHVMMCIPWCLNSNVSTYRKMVELLMKNAVHQDREINNVAEATLRQLVLKKNSKVLIASFPRLAFKLDEKSGSVLYYNYLTSNEYLRLLEIYVDLLKNWLQSFTDSSKQEEESHELYERNHPSIAKEEPVNFKVVDEIEMKNIITIIDEVEGNGLFFFFSHDFHVRHLGSQILRLVVQFDEVIYDMTTNSNAADSVHSGKRSHARMPSKFVAELGTRLIQVLETTDFFELISGIKAELSVPERTRLNKLQQKQRKDILIRLAESGYGVDSALWFRVFPKVLTILVKHCPIQIAITRSYSCIRLVQLYDQIFDYSRSYQGNVSMIREYKIFLMIACSSLTSTSEQRLHIPHMPTSSISSLSSPLSKSHARKKSQQMFTVQHQKITSAKSIFKMVIPLLTTKQADVKDAIVTGLSCINVNIFTSFLSSIEPSMETWKVNPKSADSDSHLRIELTRILNNVTLQYSKEEVVFADDWIVERLVAFIKSIKTFLSHPGVQQNFEFQKWRRYFAGFLENTYLGIKEFNDIEKWLPFEARTGCFTYLEEWCGYGQYTEFEDTRYKYMLKSVSTLKDNVTLSATIELERIALEYTAISCMASLCSSPITQTVQDGDKSIVMSFDIGGMINWIDGLFGSKNERIRFLGRKALLSLLLVNSQVGGIANEIIKRCYTYHEEDTALESYFLTLAEAFIEGAQFPYEVYQPLALSLFSAGSDNFEVRKAAAKLLAYTEKKFYNTSMSEAFIESVSSRTKVIYKRALFNLSSHFASAHPEQNFKIISELTMLFHMVGNEPRRDILAVLLPWVQTVELNMSEGNPNHANSDMVLNNLFEITIKFSDKIQNEVEALWVALATGSNGNNIKEIYQFITSNSLERRNPIFVEYARQVVVYMSSTLAGADLIDMLVSNLEPKSMVPGHQKSLPLPPKSDDLPYVADLWRSLNYSGKEAVFSLGQLSMIFLVDLLVSPGEAIRQKLHLLLHVCFVFLDHYLKIVQNQACVLLVHLIHKFGSDGPEARSTMEILRKPDFHKRLWAYDDLNTDKNGARTPENMDSLIRSSLTIFRESVPDLQEKWERVALQWATSCAVRHIACRSFQVFRSLLFFLDQGMLRDMLHRLSNTVSDETPDIQGFAMQILMTLNAITAELDAQQLIDFPQLFWSVVACLSTVHEQEFLEVLSTLSKFVSKIDLDSEETVRCLISTFPSKWEGRFDGLQSVILTGLRSSNVWDPSLKLLDRLNRLQHSEIVGSGDQRLLIALLANMPRFLHAQATKRFTDDVVEGATILSEMAARENAPGLSKIIDSFVKKKFRTKDDFLSQVVTDIKRNFFPAYGAQILVFLLGLLSNSIGWIKLETMDLLKYIFPAVNLQGDEFVGVGADLISPLLRLLLTEYAEQALEVLDETVIIPGSQLDKDVLRMSLGNRAMRKEYEKTATLFGIPDDSGWAIPMPAVTAATARNNVHAVFSTCVIAPDEENMAGEELPMTEEEQIQFHLDEYPYQQDPNFMEATDAASTDERDPSLSHMLATLDNLDSFFTKDDLPKAKPAKYQSSARSHQYNDSLDTRYSDVINSPIIPFESAPQVYDAKVTAILNRSLNRTASNTSYKASMADSFGNNQAVEPVSSPAPATPTERHVAQQRSSYMSFKSSRNNVRRSLLDHSGVNGSNDDHSKSKSPKNSPQFSSPVLSASDGAISGSSNGTSEQSEGLFRFDGLLRTSNKMKKRPVKGNGLVMGARGADVESQIISRPSSAITVQSNGDRVNSAGTALANSASSGTPIHSRARERASMFARNNKRNSAKTIGPKFESEK
ncbi:unnamed protein product [Kuraishia capsulata CBS 1993]|uniref:Cell morphogenesis protein PAG1 n=1 Tax=Kuraishia capsulata CBS 1993 TaxID=1382522 RepID=W6MRR1_9ASCO|nr:uncharacterized protein KUCA_T00005030001 [Kuraishia capsulata CBS 1993]CDK29043.1 unnamed protein product [Kuraishia capsulata CBS 1993]